MINDKNEEILGAVIKLEEIEKEFYMKKRN